MNPITRRNPRTLPSMPSWARYVVAGVVLACMVWAMLLLQRLGEEPPIEEGVIPEQVIVVPELDDTILASVRDASRRDRLQVEPQALSHLLAEAIDVGPTVATALRMPEEMIPANELQQNADSWRNRWLWYEGRIVQLKGPRNGHPIRGYSVYEATIELADGAHILSTFSIAPDGFKKGDWVRIEGYLMKLRDVTYPRELSSVPMLVGRELQPDYVDWPAVTSLDAELLAQIDDGTVWPGDPSWNWIEEDQNEALWHLSSFVRDTADTRDAKAWRKVPPLAVGKVYDRLVAEGIQRGEPIRVFGTLIRRQTITAPPNPANIKHWTTAWVQTSSFGGHLVPIWIPGKARDLPRRAQLEVRGHYYRWYVYESDRKRIRIPLFLASDLHEFDLKTGYTMTIIGGCIAAVVSILLLLLILSQRRVARQAERHSRDMDARRRRRRERLANRAGDDTASAKA
ncbi:MAG: hypothetical protein AB8H80_15565 [Planctomycetota bacterium]